MGTRLSREVLLSMGYCLDLFGRYEYKNLTFTVSHHNGSRKLDNKHRYSRANYKVMSINGWALVRTKEDLTNFMKLGLIADGNALPDIERSDIYTIGGYRVSVFLCSGPFRISEICIRERTGPNHFVEILHLNRIYFLEQLKGISDYIGINLEKLIYDKT